MVTVGSTVDHFLNLKSAANKHEQIFYDPK